jgi:hypothetical protein
MSRQSVNSHECLISWMRRQITLSLRVSSFEMSKSYPALADNPFTQSLQVMDTRTRSRS